MKPKTQELLNIISRHKNLNEFLSSEEDVFIEKQPYEMLSELMHKKGLNKSEIIARSGLDTIYAYQIFQGKRNPSRNKLLALLCAMNCSFDEVQSFLKKSGNVPLYPYNKRDSVIIFSLYHGHSLIDINEILMDLGFELLV